ncbi:MAG TPA: PHP domain-containing protein, partial [Acidobacteriota bacterium]|nr:PHP domain-containing protein [Acidobacteriota bacterium]
MELRLFRADLHIHTCLSPCGELTMYPRAVAAAALAAGLDIIAVTDHNSTENAAAVRAAARGTRLAVLPGLEITTEEEAHILGIFDAGADLAPVQETVYGRLPDAPSLRSFSEDQVIVDAEDGVTGFNPHGLFGATMLSAREAVGLIHDHGGLAVAAHLDRPSFSVLSQLGFIPPGLELDAVEGSPLLTLEEAVNTFRLETPLPILLSSDAHKPEDIGAA